MLPSHVFSHTRRQEGTSASEDGTKVDKNITLKFLMRLILFIITRQIYLLLSHLALYKQIFDIRINLFSTVCFIYHIIYIITN